MKKKEGTFEEAERYITQKRACARTILGFFKLTKKDWNSKKGLPFYTIDFKHVEKDNLNRLNIDIIQKC